MQKYITILPQQNIRIVKTPKGKIHKKEISESNIFTLQEFNEFISQIDSEIEKTNNQELIDFKFGIQLLFWTGLRIGEALALRVCDLKYNETHSLYYAVIDKKYYANILSHETKTAKGERFIGIMEVFESILIDRISYLKRIDGYTDEFEIMSSNGKNIKYSKWNSMYETQMNELQKKSTLHKLRNSHATYLKSIGLTSSEIIDRMGHVDTKMTEDYQIKTLEQELNLAKKINNIGVKLGSTK